MIIDLAIVIPYYNESKTILKTLQQLTNQTYKPKEVILINSSSTDNTSNIIESWISKNKNDQTLFKNIFKNTSLPSSSKNLGVKNSSSKYLAFMDCDLFFSDRWIEDQYNKLIKNDIDVVFGTVRLTGKSNFDICCVSQTYGYNKTHECVPGTLMKKSTFEKIKGFKEFRAGYDPFWRKQIKESKIRFFVPKDTIVEYMGINYAKNYKQLVSKTIAYTMASETLYKSYKNNFLLILSIFSFPLAIFLPELLINLLLIYIILRGYLLPLIKSRMVVSLIYNPYIILNLPLVGLVIDSSKIIGTLKTRIKALLN